MTDIIKDVEDDLRECVREALLDRAHRAAGELTSIICTIAADEESALEGLAAINNDMRRAIKTLYTDHDRKIN